MNQTIITKNIQETQNFAKNLASDFDSGGVIALSGELGAGKTTFVQGFAEGLGIKDKIISPTFVLVRQHPIPGKKLTLFHIDLYRLEDVKDFETIGLEDILESGNIVLVEWAEKLDKWPKNTTKINLKVLSENSRQITVDSKE